MVDGFVMGVGIALGLITVLIVASLVVKLYRWADFKIYWALRRREARKQERNQNAP